MKTFFWGVVVGICMTIAVLSNLDVEEPTISVPVSQQQKIYL